MSTPESLVLALSEGNGVYSCPRALVRALVLLSKQRVDDKDNVEIVLQAFVDDVNGWKEIIAGSLPGDDALRETLVSFPDIVSNFCLNPKITRDLEMAAATTFVTAMQSMTSDTEYTLQHLLKRVSKRGGRMREELARRCRVEDSRLADEPGLAKEILRQWEWKFDRAGLRGPRTKLLSLLDTPAVKRYLAVHAWTDQALVDHLPLCLCVAEAVPTDILLQRWCSPATSKNSTKRQILALALALTRKLHNKEVMPGHIGGVMSGIRMRLGQDDEECRSCGMYVAKSLSLLHTSSDEGGGGAPSSLESSSQAQAEAQTQTPNDQVSHPFHDVFPDLTYDSELGAYFQLATRAWESDEECLISVMDDNHDDGCKDVDSKTATIYQNYPKFSGGGNNISSFPFTVKSKGKEANGHMRESDGDRKRGKDADVDVETGSPSLDRDSETSDSDDESDWSLDEIEEDSVLQPLPEMRALSLGKGDEQNLGNQEDINPRFLGDCFEDLNPNDLQKKEPQEAHDQILGALRAIPHAIGPKVPKLTERLLVLGDSYNMENFEELLLDAIVSVGDYASLTRCWCSEGVGEKMRILTSLQRIARALANSPAQNDVYKREVVDTISSGIGMLSAGGPNTRSPDGSLWLAPTHTTTRTLPSKKQGPSSTLASTKSSFTAPHPTVNRFPLLDFFLPLWRHAPAMEYPILLTPWIFTLATFLSLSHHLGTSVSTCIEKAFQILQACHAHPEAAVRRATMYMLSRCILLMSNNRSAATPAASASGRLYHSGESEESWATDCRGIWVWATEWLRTAARMDPDALVRSMAAGMLSEVERRASPILHEAALCFGGDGR